MLFIDGITLKNKEIKKPPDGESGGKKELSWL
ncbi:hypothetical protein CMALT394_210037 [Carnobacterium maltaromaticum]|nr:hypothetical protein CMALT394_210037 [Carnobacterium maltaromaticum]